MNSGTEISSERLDELLLIAGTHSLFLAAVGEDGTVVYLRLSADINEKPLEEIAERVVSAHKRRRKGPQSGLHYH